MGSAGPEDIKGVGDARDLLGVDREASNAKIKRAFEEIADEADGESYWAVVVAQEIALLNSTSTGKTVYAVLRKDVHPEDISSVADAQSLLNAAPPPQNTRSLRSYNRGIKNTAEDAEQRLKELSENPRFDIVQSNIQAVSVANYVLHYQDLEKGKRYVLGPDGCSERSTTSSNQDDLILGWKYSVEPANDREYYAHGDKIITVDQRLNPETTSTKYLVSFSDENGGYIKSEFHRYGEAKRKVKQWVIDPPDL